MSASRPDPDAVVDLVDRSGGLVDRQDLADRWHLRRQGVAWRLENAAARGLLPQPVKVSADGRSFWLYSQVEHLATWPPADSDTTDPQEN